MAHFDTTGLCDADGCLDEILEQHLRESEATVRHRALVAFELLADGRCSIDGKTLPKDGLGLPLAWFALCAQQTRQAPPRAEWIYRNHKRPGACAKNALARAAQHVEPHSVELASAIRAIGVESGCLVPKHRIVGLHCTSEALARACSP